MNLNEIIKIIDKIDNSSVNQFEIVDDKFQMYISKDNNNVVSVQSTNDKVQVLNQNVIPQDSLNDNDTTVKSPLVGIYYESPSPDAKSFVNIGDTVKEGDVICIIEAMKIFNEIKSPCNGIVKKILVSNLDIIEFEQPLIIIGEDTNDTN
ncbi:MAG: acetyl-CoA carboxylase biotin carboxyl carrier protein [Eubacteriaceae bacterium]